MFCTVAMYMPRTSLFLLASFISPYPMSSGVFIAGGLFCDGSTTPPSDLPTENDGMITTIRASVMAIKARTDADMIIFVLVQKFFIVQMFLELVLFIGYLLKIGLC